MPDTKSIVIKNALRLLTLAGLVHPVVCTSAHGTPLGAETNDNYTKYLFFDLGVMQTMLGISGADIFTAGEVDFVNKGGISEMFAGLEMMKYNDCFAKPEMYYWRCLDKNSQAEVDYVTTRSGKVLPVEVKASTQGSMQSLWIFLRGHNLYNSVRTSLENFGQLYYYDKKVDDAERHVDIIPLYALSNLQNLELLK